MSKLLVNNFRSVWYYKRFAITKVLPPQWTFLSTYFFFFFLHKINLVTKTNKRTFWKNDQKRMPLNVLCIKLNDELETVLIIQNEQKLVSQTAFKKNTEK